MLIKLSLLVTNPNTSETFGWLGGLYIAREQSTGCAVFFLDNNELVLKLVEFVDCLSNVNGLEGHDEHTEIGYNWGFSVHLHLIT